MKTVASLMIEPDPKNIHYMQKKWWCIDNFLDKKGREVLGPTSSAK